jgi:predicted dehydrogenase
MRSPQPGTYPGEHAAPCRSDRLQRTTGAPISVVLIGAGRRGLDIHIPALAASRSLRLTAIVETPQRLAALRAKPGLDVPIHHNLASGLAVGDPDLAILAAPPDSNVRLARSLLEAGIPTLIEKPPARNAPELAGLIRTSKDHQTPLATILPLRYKAEYQPFVRRLRSPGLTGAMVEINADVASRPGIDNWRLSREHAGGGVLIDLGYHYLDLLIASLGRPDSSSAQLRTQGSSDDAVEDEASVSLSFHERRLIASIRLRSGPGLTKNSELLITKNDKIVYSSSDPMQSAAEDQGSRGRTQRVGSATMTQLRALLKSGFLEGRGEWNEELAMQLEVLSLVDDLYATADRVPGLGGRIV